MPSIRAWDLPTRLTHWLLAACIGLSWWTAEARLMEWHRLSGYALLGLVVFRIYWGIAGSSTARFAEFVSGPRAVIAYLRRHPQSEEPVGHTPPGSWSAIVMLALVLGQVTLGLFVTDIDGLDSGPLSHWVSFDTGRTLADVHEALFNVLLAAIGLHILAVAYYVLYRRNNLLIAMLSGRKRAHGAEAGMRAAPTWRIWPGVGLAALVVWLVTR